MTGVFRISKPGVHVPEHLAMNIVGRTTRPLSTYTRTNKPISGQTLISSVFPLFSHDGRVKVENGQLIGGLLKKGAFNGSINDSSDGLITILYNDYTPTRCGQFINDIQAVVTKYNLHTGFSVGVSDLIASGDVHSKIQDSIVDARQKIADLISSVHAGQFLNDSARADGNELEIQILDILRGASATIAETTMGAMSKSNRMVEMVDSGSKGSELNIAQMIALLGQQFVVGKRIQNTLQDRTLPHFAKYDHGLASHGFVENSFISGLNPTEFFFHAMAGREGLIDTAIKTSTSGYVQRKLVKAMEDLHVAYDGTIRNATGSIIQFRYGGDGVEPTSLESQLCELGVMSMEDVFHAFGASVSDYQSVCVPAADVHPDTFVDQILEDRAFLVHNVWRYRKDTKLFAPVNIRRIMTKYTNPYATKTDLLPSHVIRQLELVCSEPIMKPNRAFHCLLRYYLAPKKVILVNRLTKALFDELITEIRVKYIQSQIHAGEMVGTIAAQSIGEPTTQLALNSFHHSGTAKANATGGVPRLEELLSATANPKTPSNVVYMTPNVATSQDKMFSVMKEIQKTTLRDITRSVRIYYDPSPTSANTAVREDADVLRAYEAFMVAHPANTSPWILRLELDRTEMARRNSTDMTLIQARIQNNNALKVFDVIPSDTNTPDKLIVRIVFQPEHAKNALALRFLEEKLLDTILTGIDGIGNVYLREVKNEMGYDMALGGYVAQKQWVLDAEGTNLLDLMVFPGVDATRTFSNDLHEVLDVFGIEAVRQCLFDEMSEVFTSEYVNYHHLITLIDTMTFTGEVQSVNRFGIVLDNGVLAHSSFEETSKVLFNASLRGQSDPMQGVSGNIMFGQKPPCGTGFVDILVDETQFPDGTEEPDHVPPTETIDSNPDDSECRIEDIELTW